MWSWWKYHPSHFLLPKYHSTVADRIIEMEQSKSMRVVVKSREIIKPSSPSPNPDHQGTFKLSLLDQFSSKIYVPTLLLYKATCLKDSERSQRLKSSLSETLTRFYPFAGRLNDPLTISCNDEGIEFSEAQVLNYSLFDVLEKPNQKQLNLLIPDEVKSPDITTRPLVYVQVSFFECGGMAVAVKVCHKICDAATFCSFMKGWADSALGNVNPATPDFSASSLFPPTNSLPPQPKISRNTNLPVRTSRFVFGPCELAALQVKATSTNIYRPSRVEAVSAFILRTALLSKHESMKKPSKLGWAVNLRSRLEPPLPEHCFGNLIGQGVIEEELDGKDLPTLVSQFRHGTLDICNDFIGALKGDESVPGSFELQMKKRNLRDKKITETIHLYIITSWCKLGFYGADFGWGKPLWVTTVGSLPMPHMFVMMDTRDGQGIEVYVSLTEDEMTSFESNQELQKYASFNPSAFI